MGTGVTFVSRLIAPPSWQSGTQCFIDLILHTAKKNPLQVREGMLLLVHTDVLAVPVCFGVVSVLSVDILAKNAFKDCFLRRILSSKQRIRLRGFRFVSLIALVRKKENKTRAIFTNGKSIVTENARELQDLVARQAAIPPRLYSTVLVMSTAASLCLFLLKAITRGGLHVVFGKGVAKRFSLVPFLLVVTSVVPKPIHLLKTIMIAHVVTSSLLREYRSGPPKSANGEGEGKVAYSLKESN